jgi:hypothetical protein
MGSDPQGLTPEGPEVRAPLLGLAGVQGRAMGSDPAGLTPVYNLRDFA